MALNIGHVNIRSLPAHFCALKAFLLNGNYDLLGITETWLTNDHLSTTFAIDNYKLLRCDREGRGGGVALYYRENLHISGEKFLSTEFSENIWVNLRLGNKLFTVGTYYRPPRGNFQQFLNEFEDSLSNYSILSDHTVCMGDFNVNLLHMHDNKTTKLIDLLQTYNLEQIINEPTRISDSSSLIDLIIVSHECPIKRRGVIGNNFSDHLGIYCVLNLRTNHRITRQFRVRSYKNFNLELFLEDLYAIPWYTIFDLHNIDQKLTFFNSNLLNLFNVHAPIKHITTSKPPAPWLTYNIQLMIKTRNDALKRFQNSRNPIHYDFYKSLRNEVNRAIKREKREYFKYEANINSNNKKALWKQLRQLNIGKTKESAIPDKLRDVDAINNFFARSLVNQPSQPSHSILCQPSLQHSFELKRLTSSDIYEAINKIKSSVAGVDGIDLKMLHICLPQVVDYIRHIFNWCIDEAVFPEIWGHALITPIPKASSVEDYKDLRPISILPTLGKVFEKCIAKQLHKFVDSYSILPTYQSGFRKSHSCVTALTGVHDDIIQATDRGEVTVLVLLDLTRAFDTVHHPSLISILQNVGLSQRGVNLLGAYLSGRKQQVILNDQKSKILHISNGVPQGAILSPLLFSIYTSGLPSRLKHCKYHLYADDTQIYLSFPSSQAVTAEEKLNYDLRNICSFAKTHHLFINPSKTQVIVFGPKKDRNRIASSLDISIESQKLLPAKHVKNLGVIFDDDLRFATYISNLVKKAVIALKSIYVHRENIDTATRSLLCESLVLSFFNYGDVIYAKCITKYASNRIQMVQNSCTRLIYGMRGRRGVSHKLKSTNTINMSNRRILHSVLFYRNIIKFETPSYLYNRVRFRHQEHQINIRRNCLLSIPKHRLEKFKQGFSYNISKILNKYLFNNNISIHSSTSTIKTLLKPMLLSTQ